VKNIPILCDYNQYATVQLQRLPNATRLALWFHTIAALGILIVVIRGAGNMYGAASKMWNKKYSGVKMYYVGKVTQ
jgi:hypothetical protein